MADNLPGLSGTMGASKALTRREWAQRRREREALEHYTAGLSYQQIKRRMNLKSDDDARELVRAGEERWDQEEGPALSRFKAAMRDDMWQLRLMLMEAAMGGDQYAAERAIKVWERMSRLLGLDAEREKGAGNTMNVVVTSGDLGAVPKGAVVIDARLPDEREGER